ncbi:MAG: alanine racemase [Alicyclobacillus macrosporangiidus]|uniref:alanine racemase n=1 Tax=Alicyclobacillus macrosporangiidus TaxID=392015 RepID=UPI0026EBCAA1|nr:alanine racemase [Alicyclobacillus macrosporangiidus]MCL6600381.1 alanine racemase [Alicyclobacillus macrosporangiidus]
MKNSTVEETQTGPGGRWRDTWAEVDLGAIMENVRSIRRHIRRPAGPGGHAETGPKLMAVVKADAYGHGAVPVARAALAAGADWLGVATLGEAMELREAGLRAPILVLGYVDAQHAPIAADAGVTLTVASLTHAFTLAETALSQPLSVHLKLDSGMSRIGVRTVEEVHQVAAALDGTPVRVTGAFTHFARADEADLAPALEQWEWAQPLFDAVRSRWPADALLLHAANSAAILALPAAHLDMVRLGISLYGVYPSGEVARTVPLRQALRLYTRVVQVKRVPAGTAVSYGGTHVTPAPAVLATLPIGYADGLLRALSNRGYVQIRGARCPMVGRVCMDQVVVDATAVPDVQEGDVATVYDEHSLADLADRAGTIPYELLCAISRRVPRVYRQPE